MSRWRQGGAGGLVALARLGQGRHAHLVAGGQARVGLGPRAADPDLAGAQQLLDLSLAQVGPAPLEPTVQPHAVLVRLHRNGEDRLHVNTLPGNGVSPFVSRGEGFLELFPVRMNREKLQTLLLERVLAGEPGATEFILGPAKPDPGGRNAR